MQGSFSKGLMSIVEVMETFLLTKEMASIKSLWVSEWDIALVETQSDYVLLDTMPELSWWLVLCERSERSPVVCPMPLCSCLCVLPEQSAWRQKNVDQENDWKISNQEELLEYKIMKFRFRKAILTWSNRSQICQLSTQNVRLCCVWGSGIFTIQPNIQVYGEGYQARERSHGVVVAGGEWKALLFCFFFFHFYKCWLTKNSL